MPKYKLKVRYDAWLLRQFVAKYLGKNQVAVKKAMQRGGHATDLQGFLDYLFEITRKDSNKISKESKL